MDYTVTLTNLGTFTGSKESLDLLSTMIFEAAIKDLDRSINSDVPELWLQDHDCKMEWVKEIGEVLGEVDHD